MLSVAAHRVDLTVVFSLDWFFLLHSRHSHTFSVEYKTIVPHTIEQLGQIFEYSRTCMAYLADLAMLNVWGMDYFTSECRTNTLMAQADPQYRNIRLLY